MVEPGTVIAERYEVVEELGHSSTNDSAARGHLAMAHSTLARSSPPLLMSSNRAGLITSSPVGKPRPTTTNVNNDSSRWMLPRKNWMSSLANCSVMYG